MGVADHIVLTSKSPRRVPSTIRLASHVVNDLCTQPRSEKSAANDSQDAVGLLFGTAEQDVLNLQGFKALPAADAPEKSSSKRECLDRAFERFVRSAKTDPDLTSLQLVGWYRIRCPGDIAPLSESDIEFHNRRFRRATDVALILKPRQHGDASIALAEFYTRSSKAAMSRQDYRSGSLVLPSAERATVPRDVAMREIVDDDYYLKVFQVLNSLDRAEKREGWKRIGLRLKAITPPSLRPEWMKTQTAPAVDTKALDGSGLPDKATIRTSPLPSDSANPQVNLPPPTARSPQTKLLWISSAVLLALAISVALAWHYDRTLLSALPGKALFHRAPASTPLSLRVEPQVGDSLLVRWDAHSASVKSAKNGTVRIDDGSEHRDLQLDPNQIANGSILYTPISRDLTFQLEIVGGNGSPISESMRVVNGSKVPLAAHTISNSRPSTLPKRTAIPKEKPDFRQSDTTPHARPTPLPVFGKTPLNVTTRPGPNVTGPPVNAQTTGTATRSSTPAPTSDGSGTMARRVLRPPTRNVSEAERRAASPIEPEPRKAVQELPPAQPPVSSPQLAVTDNSTSAKYVPPRPLKQVMPSPSNFPASALSGATDIEVEVRIDDAGRVTEARVVNNISDNNGIFTSAALAAAKEWIFEPAQRHGKSVPSSHVIKFRFHPRVGQQ